MTQQFLNLSELAADHFVMTILLIFLAVVIILMVFLRTNIFRHHQCRQGSCDHSVCLLRRLQETRLSEKRMNRLEP